ncbi:MAG: hypothetical protein HZA01_04760 [Nitrospinae bacterium]|nr:hypothetical protein [Nitrospinota bacterium]
MKSLLSVLLALFVLTGCAGYQTLSAPANNLFLQSKFDEAALEYSKQVDGAGNARLLALLDAGLAWHYAGEYERSNRYFTAAEKLADKLEIVSVSSEAASLLATDYILKYGGDDFEKLLINTYMAFNYLLLDDLENAMVEIRRFNEKLAKYERRCDCEYGINPFTEYLSGILYEMDGKPDDAYIDYKKVYEVMPDFALLPNDLARLSGELNRGEDHDRWKSMFGVQPPKTGPRSGELVVVFECGLSPEKRQDQRVIAIPAYYPRYSVIQGARVIVDGKPIGNTHVLNDIEKIATEQLKDKMGRMLLKQGIATGGKIAAAETIRKKSNSDALGNLALLFFYATNEADTRSWLTLPGNMQIQRVTLPAGRHGVSLKLLDGSGRERETVDLGEVRIPANGKKFISYRSVY